MSLQICPECHHLTIEFDSHQGVYRCIYKRCGWVNRGGHFVEGEPESFEFSRVMEARVRDRDEGGAMNWNYRAIKEVCEGETVCRVYEVYYDEEKEITGWTADAIHAQGETLEELRAELIMMLHDVSQLPMLDMEELRKQFPGDEGER